MKNILALRPTALLILLFSSLGFAQSSNLSDLSSLQTQIDTKSESAARVTEPILLGHNLTPTSYTLHQGELTVGTYALAYGITDSWMISTSPWFDWGYNMPMIETRYLFFKTDKGFRLSGEAVYFKTYDAGPYSYDQESMYERLTASQKFSDFYTMHVCGGFQYFWDDLVPYSLRRVPGNTDPYTTSLSSLHEMHWFKHWGTFFEAGVLGLNYETPYLHIGASVFTQWDWGMFQFGLSRSSSMGYVHYVDQYSDVNFIDTVVHPEVQFQAYF